VEIVYQRVAAIDVHKKKQIAVAVPTPGGPGRQRRQQVREYARFYAAFAGGAAVTERSPACRTATIPATSRIPPRVKAVAGVTLRLPITLSPSWCQCPASGAGQTPPFAPGGWMYPRAARPAQSALQMTTSLSARSWNTR
jgi:hypothetical protein